VKLALLDLSDRPGKEAETSRKLTDLAAEYPNVRRGTVEQSGEQLPGRGPGLPSISGKFEELDCSGPTPKLVLETSAGKVAFLMDQPDRVNHFRIKQRHGRYELRASEISAGAGPI
jgi:hypothetical protein